MLQIKNYFLPLFAVIFLAMGGLVSCGSGSSDGSLSQGQNPTTPTSPSVVISTSDANAVPPSNLAQVSVIADSAGVPVLQTTTPASATQPVGAYVGGGTGNKSIVGIKGFDGLSISNLQSIEIDTKFISGTTNSLYFNFVVDLDCVKDEDLTTLTLADLKVRRRLVVWIPTGGVLQADGYTRYSVTRTDASWLMVGSPTYGLGLNPSGPATALTSFAGYPNACLVDGASGDGGLPRNTSFPACVSSTALPAATTLGQCSLPTKSVLLIMGDSLNTSALERHVKRLKINDTEVTFSP